MAARSASRVARSGTAVGASIAPSLVAILSGPCDSSRPACSKDRMSTGWSRWSSSRSPSAGGGPGTASAIPSATPSCGSGRRSRRAGGRTAIVPSPRGCAACGPITARGPAACASTAPRTRATGSSRCLARRRAGAGHRGGRARPHGQGRLAGAACAPDRRADPPARSLERAHRGGAHHPAVLDPRRRPAGPGGLDLGHQRQEHGHAADRAHPDRRRAACRDDHLRRRPRRWPHGRPGRLDRPGGGAADPGPPRHRCRRPRDRPRWDGAAGRRLRVQRGERPDQRLVRPPRPAGDPHPPRARRGEVHDLPDHEAGRLGRAQRRRPARGRGRAPRARAGGVLLARRVVIDRHAASSPWRARLHRRGAASSSRRTATARPRSPRSAGSRSRSAGWRATTSRMRSRPPGAPAASARPWTRCATASWTSAPPRTSRRAA